MSRMTTVGTTAAILSNTQTSPDAAALVAVMREMQTMDQRWTAWRTEIKTRLQEADALITGLHQDNANLILKMQALLRWGQKHWDTFETEIQDEYTALLAEVEALGQPTKEKARQLPRPEGRSL